MANFFGPLVTVLTGLHCTAKEGLHETPPKRQFKEHYGIFHSCQLLVGGKRWCSGKSTRLPPMWHRCKFWCWHHVWDEFVVDSLPLPWVVFLWYASFSLSSKTRNGKRRTTANMYVDMLPPDHYFCSLLKKITFLIKRFAVRIVDNFWYWRLIESHHRHSECWIHQSSC